MFYEDGLVYRRELSYLLLFSPFDGEIVQSWGFLELQEHEIFLLLWDNKLDFDDFHLQDYVL